MSTDEFFSAAESRLVRTPVPLRPLCDKCGLFNHCRSPKMKVDGQGERGILLVSEFPGEKEDLEGRPLIGPTGQLVRETLGSFGINMRRDCWLTNAIICRPQNAKTYSTTVVDYCRPNLLRTIRELNPEVIILLGGEAVRSLIGYLWKPNTGPNARWVGWQIPSQQLNAWVCPTYQPAQLFYKDNKDPVLEMELTEHIEAAVALAGTRPWPGGIPNYERDVEIILSAADAARRIRKYTSGMVAFDLETNTLKPDSASAEIVCCSVCWEGEETIAFPWYGEVKRAMVELLTNSDVGKVGWNAKFEDRWIRAKLGVQVDGWYWDGMLAAHMLDPRGGKDGENRKDQVGITGLKFQSFVKLGMGDYNQHIEPFLKSADKGCNSLNRIRDVNINLLCHYCALDSLLEWKVSQLQMKECGV